ncbi:Pre-mRNA-splicing factor SYF1 [Spatholobus suberectus]|nr:Pre-mRNA-splicing factor SYF1 [Spatholobus suberectus]
MAISLFPLEEEDLPYEEALLRDPLSVSLWWRYLAARSGPASFVKRCAINERALNVLPGSYKLWNAYLRDLTAHSHHSQYDAVNDAFERALVTMHKMPRIWLMYLQTLTDQNLLTRTRATFDRALRALPVPQHHRLWGPYVAFVTRNGITPAETSLRANRRYLNFNPSHVGGLVEFLINSGLNVEGIIRGGIGEFGDELGGFLTSLAEYYIRSGRGLCEKARDVFKEGMSTVGTVRDFGVVFDSRRIVEISGLSDEDGRSTEEDFERRPELANSVVLRPDPQNVEQWHRRVKLFEGNPAKQVTTYIEAVKTVDPVKAVGKPHTLWVAFAKLCEQQGDLANARVIFDMAAQVNYKTVDDLASVWCEWAGMEFKHRNLKGALELMRQATSEPSVEVKRRVAADGNEPVHMNLHKSLRLWTFYVDLEESLGTLESARAVYEQILDLQIATSQIIINYAYFLEQHKYFEDAFEVYERGVKIFKYPHVKDIWVTYLSKFVKRYGKTKLEKARELFENAVESAPADQVKPLYLQYAKLEEDYGLAKRAMKVYDQATKAVPNNEKLSMYEIYIARAAEIFGVPKAREIYEQAMESGLPDKDVKTICLKYAELEKSLGEIHRAREIYVSTSQFVDPRSDPEFWNKWHEFEVQHGNKDTIREMLRIKQSVSASYSRTQFMLPEYLIQKDDTVNLDEAKDKLKQAGIPEDEMAAVERKFSPAA